ncbi:hemerythrin domain-containing protein [Sphingobium rhizovicinum]|uniref:Hemerythrin domain-containing protein n=1 Tax=Sphingobium rhizovicinum TaxID=432308 RepID=A0ABV7NPD9_9SPHN
MSVMDKLIAAVTPPESSEARAKAREEARQTAVSGDWLDQILTHHEQIDDAFDKAEAATGATDRTAALKELGALLTGHSMAEEAVIYPQLSHEHKGPMGMSYQEQQAAKVQVALLEALDPLSQDWVDKLGQLRGAVAHHVYEEEGSRFLKLHEELPAHVQAHMTQRYREETTRYGASLA